VNVQVTPSVFCGLEYWMRGEVLAQDDGSGAGGFNAGPHHYLGPTLALSFGKFFFSAGLYMRLSDFGRVLGPGDAYGATWLRTVAGISF